MPHKEWELLSAFLDGELTGPERAGVAAHLAACAECAREFNELAVMEKATAAAPRHGMPPALLAKLESRFAKPTWAQRFRASLSSPRVLLPMGAAAALAFAFWFNSREEEQIPLESLLAAHARYSAEGLLPQENMAHPELVDRLSLADAN